MTTRKLSFFGNSSILCKVRASLAKKMGEHATRNLTIALSFYAPEGAQLSMPLAILNGILKQRFPHDAVHLLAINKTLPPESSSTEWFFSELARLQPDLLAVSCMSPHWTEMRAYIEAAKRASPKTRILVGGYQPILAPEETISHPCVDLICIGDGEEAFIDIVSRLKQSVHADSLQTQAIPGCWVKRPDGSLSKGARILTHDLNAYPFPDFSIFEINGSLRGLGISVFGPRETFILPVMTGRGCPYKCTYCSNTPLLEMYKGEGSYIRKYDIDVLIDELVSLRDHYQVGYFEFWDELFMVNVRYALKFFDQYRTRVGVPFSINARVERMDDEFCAAAKMAGCHNIWFGIESGSETYRERYLGRKMSNRSILIAAENAKKHGIRRLIFNIVGMPFESFADAEATLQLNLAIAPEFFYFFTYIPLEGTPLYEAARHAGILIDKDNVSADYLKGLRNNQFQMNLKEHEGGMSYRDFNVICTRMAEFQRENNQIPL